MLPPPVELNVVVETGKRIRLTIDVVGIVGNKLCETGCELRRFDHDIQRLPTASSNATGLPWLHCSSEADTELFYCCSGDEAK